MNEPSKAPLIQGMAEAILILIASLVIGAVISLPFLDVLNIKSGPVAHAFTVIHAFMVQTVWYLRVFFRLDRVLPKFVYLIIVLGPALLFGGILALVMPSEWLGLVKFFGWEGSAFLMIFVTQAVICCDGMYKLRKDGPSRREDHG